VLAKAASAAGSVISLKVTLGGIRPPIWRRLVVPARMTLGELHRAIQAAMGWQHAHLHAFDVGGQQYGDPRTVDDMANEKRLTVESLRTSGVNRFTYMYDFGDGWEHAILIEARPPPAEARAYPACVAGKRNCPPEDCGGIWGYQELLEARGDPAHPRHDDWREMGREDFDPDAFSVEESDARVAAQFHRG